MMQLENMSFRQHAQSQLTLWSAVVFFLAGTSTVAAWSFHWNDLLPHLLGSRVMSPDAGAGFILVAIFLILFRLRRAPAFCMGMGFICILAGAAIGFLDRMHTAFSLTEALWQSLQIPSSPNSLHMALGTAIGFSLWGIGLVCLIGSRKQFHMACNFIAAACGILIAVIGSTYLLDYCIGVPERFSGIWSSWIFRIAIETAALLILLGIVLCLEAWNEAQTRIDNNHCQISLIASLLAGAGIFLMFLLSILNLHWGLNDVWRLRGEIAIEFQGAKVINELVAAVREAESGQRGFVLTGDESYLDNYYSGLKRLRAMQTKYAAVNYRWSVYRLNKLTEQRIWELAETIKFIHDGNRDKALTIIKAGDGQSLMIKIQQEADRISSDFQQALTKLLMEYQDNAVLLKRSIVASYSFAFMSLFYVVHMFRKELQRRAAVEKELRVKDKELEMRIEERTAALQTSESRYRSMMEQAPFAIHVFDKNGNSAGVNPAFERFFGVGTEALRTYNIWADPQPAQQGTANLLKRVFAGEFVATGTIRHDPALSIGTALAGAKANPTWVEFSAYPVKSSTGEVQEIVLLCQDVTTRETALAAVQESESNFQQLTDVLPQIVWTATPDGGVDYYNQRWYEFTGLSRCPEQSWELVVHPDDLKLRSESWRSSIASKNPHTFELRLWDCSLNHYRWHLVRAVPVIKPSGEVQRWIGSTTDIHDKKQAEQVLEEKVRVRTAELQRSYQDLQSTEEELRRSLKEREILFREVHHRVKNNLQVISSLLRMHGNSLVNQPVASEALTEARRRVLTMSMIHERLYNNQRMDQINFSEYIETLVRELIYSFSSPERKVESRINAEQIYVDVEQAIPCGLILNELVTNSLKHAFKGRTSGIITVNLLQAGENEVILVVADDGVGLPDGFNWKKSKSMGFPIVGILARQLEGAMDIDSTGGLKVTIRFRYKVPVAKAA